MVTFPAATTAVYLVGNGSVTGLLAQAVIASEAERAEKITSLAEAKISQIEKPRKRTLRCRPRLLIASQFPKKRGTGKLQTLSSKDADDR